MSCLPCAWKCRLPLQGVPGFSAHAKDGVLGWVGRVRKIDQENGDDVTVEVSFTDGKSSLALSELSKHCYPIS